MRRLIVNADDFGYARGVNEGILLAHTRGIVSSATIMANAPFFDDAVARAKSVPSLGVGIHLVLIGGKSVQPQDRVPGLVDASGAFPRTLSQFLRKLILKRINLGEVEDELRAQIQKVKDAGVEPTHLDSHKHTHVHPAIFRVVARLATEFNIRWVRKPFEQRLPAGLSYPSKRTFQKQKLEAQAAKWYQSSWTRIQRKSSVGTPDHFLGFAGTGLLDRDSLSFLLRNLRDGVTELMCHPAVCDAELMASATRLKEQRQRELEALTDASILSIFKEQGITLINFREL